MSALPETMTVIAIAGKGGPEVLVPQTLPVPTPGAGQVLVKVQAAGVNRPDVLQRLGLYPAPKGHNELPGLEIAGEDGTYRVPQASERHAGLVLTLAKQEWPDLSGYTDAEIVYRVRKPNHAGLIVASSDEARVRALLDQYSRRFQQDFYAFVPAPERPPA